METVNRILQEKITARIAPNKAVLIFGARRVGKTVMMRKIVDNYSGRTMMLNGEDYDTLALLENRSIANYRHLLDGIDLLAIDEAQNIPQIGSILKLIVDEIPGISVLASGSSSFDLLNKTGEPLVGRSTQFLLTPFSQREIAQTETALETRQNLEARLIYGSYPEVVMMENYEVFTCKKLLMTKKKLPVRFTGQHFTIDKVLIKDAIRQANISNQDTVLDIGAGKGFLTVHLLKIANNVVAIENDTALVEHLRKLFSDARNVQVVGCDFRNFAVPKFPFKVVSNIPYGITSDIFKILMFESLGNFLGGSIVLQLEPTQKLFSRKLYNPYTVFYHTFFDLKLVYEVGPESFLPPPTVKSALLNIKRKHLFFDFKFKAKYLAFISCLLEKPDLSVKTALKSIFRKSQVRSISEKFGLNLNAQIVCLSPSQWLNCFLEMLEVVPEKFHPS